MHSKTFFSATLIAFLFVGFQASADCNGRYQTEVFPNVTTTSDVQYGQNINSQGNMQDLFMDIYEPTGDTATERPLVIFAHGGSFFAGSKESGDMVRLCEDMAKRGYVAVSMQYRLEPSAFSLNSTQAMVKAVMRAVQDGKAVIRFFRADAAGSDTYKIDADQVFIGGTSAGGVLALHIPYLNDTNKLTPQWRGWAADLGGLDGDSGNPGFSTDVKGVFAYAGALGDSSWLTADVNVPFMTMHSEDDGTVPYAVGKPFNSPVLPNLYGGYVLKERAKRLGVYNPFYSYEGGAHPPFFSGGSIDADLMDSTELYTSQFLYNFLDCNPNPNSATGIESTSMQQVNVVPNPSNGVFRLTGLSEYENISIRLFDTNGRLLNETMGLEINQPELPAGIYLLEIQEDGELLGHERLVIE